MRQTPFVLSLLSEDGLCAAEGYIFNSFLFLFSHSLSQSLLDIGSEVLNVRALQV